MCQDLERNLAQKSSEDSKKEIQENNLANLSLHTEVFLQTIRVKLKNQGQERIIRAVLDSASPRTYISSQIADGIGYSPNGEHKMIHMLFGGTKPNLKFMTVIWSTW